MYPPLVKKENYFQERMTLGKEGGKGWGDIINKFGGAWGRLSGR